MGFSSQGGNRDHHFAEGDEGHALGRALHLSWRQKVTDGFFLRAETFFNFATYLETVGSTFGPYGGQSLHAQSHGEAFLSLFQHRFEDGLYLLDEPEAALSPQRQLAFLGMLHSLTASRIAHRSRRVPYPSRVPSCQQLHQEPGGECSRGGHDIGHDAEQLPSDSGPPAQAGG